MEKRWGERKTALSETEKGILICAPCWLANVQRVKCVAVCLSWSPQWLVCPSFMQSGFDVFCCEALVRLWGEGVMIDLKKKKQHLGRTPDSPAISTKAAGWIMQEPYSPLCLILHCFCRENFCLPSKSCHLWLSSRLSNHQNGIKCCKAAQQENFQKSEPICRAALVENVFCSRQNFPSVLSTEKFTDFSQWNLLEFIGSWLAVTD